MINKRIFSFCIALAMTVTAVLSNVGSVFAANGDTIGLLIADDFAANADSANTVSYADSKGMVWSIIKTAVATQSGTVDGTSVANAFKAGGATKYTDGIPNQRAISFSTTGAATVTIYAKTTSDNRSGILVDSSGNQTNIGDALLKSESVTSRTVKITEGGTYYICWGADFYLYGVKVVDNSSGGDTPVDPTPSFDGATISGTIKYTVDTIATSAAFDLIIDQDGAATFNKKSDQANLILSSSVDGQTVNVVLADGTDTSKISIDKTSSDDYSFTGSGAEHKITVNNKEYTIKFTAEDGEIITPTPVEDDSFNFNIVYDSTSNAAIAVEVGTNSSVNITSNDGVVKEASISGTTVSVTLNKDLDLSKTVINADGFTVSGSDGSYTLTKDDKTYTVKIIAESTSGGEDEPDTPTPPVVEDGKVTVPCTLTINNQSSDVNLPWNEDGTVNRVSLDDYATVKGFFAMVPTYGAATASGGTENYMTIGKSGTFRTRGNGSVEQRCLRFTPAEDGWVTQLVFKGASGTSATTAYFQQVDDPSTNVAFAKSIANKTEFNETLALEVKADKEYVIYADVSMDITSIKIEKEKPYIFEGAEVGLNIEYDGVKDSSVLKIDKDGALTVSDVNSEALISKAEVSGTTVTYTVSLDEAEDLSKLSVSSADSAYELSGSGKSYTVTVNDKTYTIKFLFSIAGQEPAEEEMVSNAKYAVETVDTDKEDNKLNVVVRLNNNDLKLTGAEGYLVYDPAIVRPVKGVSAEGALSCNGSAFVAVDNINTAIASSASGKLKIVGETLTASTDSIAYTQESGILCSVEFEILNSGDTSFEFVHNKANALNNRNQVVPVVSIANADAVSAAVTRIGDPIDPDDPDTPVNPVVQYDHFTGDVNYDKAVTSTDAALVIKSSMGTGVKYDADADTLKIADVNGDNKVDSTDAALIIKKALNGSSYTFPAGDTVKVSQNFYNK